MVNDRLQFNIKPSRNSVMVYYCGKFWETADSYNEAEKDITNFLNKTDGEDT